MTCSDTWPNNITSSLKYWNYRKTRHTMYLLIDIFLYIFAALKLI